MSIKLVVLDFNGTLTDMDKEAVPCIEGHKKDLAGALGISHDKLEDRWAKAQKKVEKEHSMHGWKSKGRIVAPAHSDPYIKAGAVSHLLLEKEHSCKDDTERRALLQRIFTDNYRKTPVIFREGAEEFLSKTRRLFDVCIITNSGKEQVMRKLSRMRQGHDDITVIGNACKHAIADDWGAMPHSIELPGLDRPILLRRQRYWNILKNLMKERGIGPEHVAVIGDNYELDLALPQQKGMHIVFLPGRDPPLSEKDAVSDYPIGCVAKDLDQAYEWLTR